MDQAPEVELIALGAAVEAAEDMTVEVDREAASIVVGAWIVDGASAAKLPAAAMQGLEAQQSEDLLDRDRGPQGLVVDAGHGEHGRGLLAAGLGVQALRSMSAIGVAF
jgi:hypothetical protein